MGKHTSTLVRSSFLGSIGGFVPGMSYAFSSMFAYSVERWIRVTNKQYKPGDVKCLIASESANNAGAFTQMVPLLFLGIPITASEALIYNILESRGLPVDIQWFTSTFNMRNNFYHKPVASVNWEYTPNDKTTLSTTLYASYGRGGGTGDIGRLYGYQYFSGDLNYNGRYALRNPQTGQTIKIKAKNVVKFKAGSELSSAVN